MKNITLSADERSIENARLYMRSQSRTLNEAFREWLDGLSKEYRSKAFHEFLDESRQQVVSGGPYSRDEMNERR